MKTILTCVSLFIGLLAIGQPDKYSTALMNTPFVAFEEQQIMFRDGVHPALSLLVLAEEGEYSKDFKSFMKSRFALDIKKNDGYYSAFNTIVGEWTLDTLNVHYKTDKDGDAVRLFLLIEMKGGFLTEKKDPEILSRVKASITQQARDFYVKYYDENISDQQKYYEEQVSDMEKLNKKKDKMNNEISDHTSAIQKNQESMREASGKISESEVKVKSLNAQLQNNQKAGEQAQKEVEANQKLIMAKELEYNKLNAAGSLDTKEGQRAIKDLEKLREKNDKLQNTFTKANETTTDTENDILKEEQNKTKLTTRLSELKSTGDKHQAEINDLKRDLETNQGLIKEEQEQMDRALSDLDKLKAAKSAFVGK